MSLKTIRKLREGDQVEWKDPSGKASGVYTIQSIALNGDIITITDTNGTSFECYANELS